MLAHFAHLGETQMSTATVKWFNASKPARDAALELVGVRTIGEALDAALG